MDNATKSTMSFIALGAMLFGAASVSLGNIQTAFAGMTDNNVLNGTGKQFTRNLLNTTQENRTAGEILASDIGPFDANTTLTAAVEQIIIEHVMAARTALDSGDSSAALDQVITALELHYGLKTVNTTAVIAGQGQPSITLDQNPDGLALTVRGSGFPANEPVTLELRVGNDTEIETEVFVTADENGSFERLFSISDGNSGRIASVEARFGQYNEKIEESITIR